jgi:putative mRNA 3-end processing factor
VVVALARAGIAMRAHQRIAAVLGRLRQACPSLPTVPRFSGRLDPGEILLWPPEARKAASLSGLGTADTALVSGSAADARAVAEMGVTRGFALTNLPSLPEIMAAIENTGAAEVALFRGAAEALAQRLRERGLDAYALDSPRQMQLPAGT